MKKIIIVFILLISITTIYMISTQIQASTEANIEELIEKMTLEEKAGQMTQINLNLVSVGDSIYQLKEPHELDEEKLRKAILQYHVGSILNCPGYALPLGHWRSIISDIQNLATNESRLKIPVLYGIDAIHGANYLTEGTLFPQPIAQAATWNLSFSKSIAEVTAYETRAMGIPWNFSPVLDVMRQPLWIRSFETYGEDVFLATQMGVEAIKGYEGNNVANPTSVASCMKHFVGYSWPANGKDRTPAYIPNTQLREYMLPPFEAAIKAGAKTLMVNSAELNGVPVHASKKILNDLLRNELGFDGLVVTDWEDIIKLHLFHRTSPTLKHAVKTAINAGIDMSMVPNDYDFTELLIELVKEGEIPESRLDESVRRILKLKFELGLFEYPILPDFEYDKVGSKEFQNLSSKVAEEAITLLKNDADLLPLKKEQNVLLTGPMANSLSMVNGAWSRTWQGTEENRNNPEKLNVFKAFQTIGSNVSLDESCSITEFKITESLKQSVVQADIIVACMGELPATEKPGDINDLTLPQHQLDYVKFLSEFNKPIVLILFESRPRIINSIVPLCTSIIQAYYPSEEGTVPLAKIVYGDVNPSGKLPYTYPRYTNNLITYDYKITEDIDENYGLNGFQPQFEFGFGLSYTTFQYSNFKIQNNQILNSNDVLKFSVDVKNTGTMIGKEVIQLFISDVYASITPPAQRLRAFEKIELKPNELQTVYFELPISELSFVNADGKWVLEDGEFIARISSLTQKFYLNSKI